MEQQNCCFNILNCFKSLSSINFHIKVGKTMFFFVCRLFLCLLLSSTSSFAYCAKAIGQIIPKFVCVKTEDKRIYVTSFNFSNVKGPGHSDLALFFCLLCNIC